MIREKGINNQYILEVGTVKYLRLPMRCPTSQLGSLHLTNKI